jgi:predicted RNase H-like nuclease (RuvC/YqgF family)
LRVDASKKKVVASKHYLKCRALEEKCAQASIKVGKHEEDILRLTKRKNHFEESAREMEKKFAGKKDLKFPKKEIEQRMRKASEIQMKIKPLEEKIEEEKKKIEEYKKKANEHLKKCEAATKESKEMEMEAVKIEIKLGIKK